jgi:hypothetical protein
VIHRDSPAYPQELDTEPGPNEHDLEQIILESGLRSRPQPPKIPTPSQVVRYAGNTYKVRAYPDSESARDYTELMGAAKPLFTRCYGQVDRFLVLEYIDGSEPDSPGQMPVDIANFLADLAAIPARRSPQDDFDTLCMNIEAAGIFQPGTVELIRGYYARTGQRNVNWGLEYYDAMPRNFAYTEDGRLVSIDEKHLRVGPRGVSLVKPMEQLPPEEFRALKQAYLARMGSVHFDDPSYHRFLQFYRHMTALGALAAFRPREANIYEYSFHLNRQVILKIIDAPLPVRISEETRWTRYWVHQTGRFFQKAWGFTKRRVMRVAGGH